MLSIDPKYPARRTYVVKFRSDATPETLCGRVENLVTCKHHEFDSAGALFEIIAHDIESGGSESPDNQ